MSWLLKSLQTYVPDSPPSRSQNLGLKEDLSELGQTIGRQLRGVALFLAPPPSLSPSQPSDDNDPQPSDTLLGIRSDLAEIGGSFKSGLSVLSSNKAVSEISRFASSLWQFEGRHGDEDDREDVEEYDGVPGTADDIVGFVRQISTRPECWTDFPMSIDNDFKMSDAQREHASVIEDLVPSFAALKTKVQSDMGEGRFWMIYFILLLPRLNEDDFELLSTPEVVKTRDLLLQKLRSNRNPQEEGGSSIDVSQEHGGTRDRQEGLVPQEEGISGITNRSKRLEIESEEENEQWLEEADVPGETCAHREGKSADKVDVDVSFSDLEDEDNDHDLRNQSSMRKSTQEGKGTSPTGSNDWVQLNECSETQGALKRPSLSSSRDKDSEGESSDWLAVDEFD